MQKTKLVYNADALKSIYQMLKQGQFLQLSSQINQLGKNQFLIHWKNGKELFWLS